MEWIPGRQYRTRAGGKARIDFVDLEMNGYGIRGVIELPDSGWTSASWLSDGRWRGCGESMHDLIGEWR